MSQIKNPHQRSRLTINVNSYIFRVLHKYNTSDNLIEREYFSFINVNNPFTYIFTIKHELELALIILSQNIILEIIRTDRTVI